MYGTIELTIAGSGGVMISLFCLFLFLVVGAVLQNDDSDSGGGDSEKSDPDFLSTVEAYFNDIDRCLSRRCEEPENGEKRDDPDEDGNGFGGWLDEVETFFDDADDEEELFASDDDEELLDDDSQKEEPDPNGRSNFSGTFFKNRNYPRDVYESEDGEQPRKRSEDEPPRWRRANDDSLQESQASGSDDDVGASGDDSFDSFDKDDDDYQDNDDSAPIEERIANLRERLQDGDESCRLELVQTLVESVSDARAEDKERFFKTLDEAQALLDASKSSFEEEDYDEAECQIALQRPVFYMRNNLKPPFELVTGALNRIREWRQKSDSSASRALLARAWLLHGQRLLASGSSAAALSSFQKARAYFKPAEDSFDDSESNFPSLGFVLVSEAEAYRMAGDVDKAIAAYREAADIFDEFRTKRVFLAQKANVLCQLSLTLRAVGRFKEALAVMRDAIAAEERLFSYDPVKYFSGLAQLLRIQSDTCFKNNDVDSAFALMDRAESILLSSLQLDVPFRRRVFAYMQLVHILRSRAGMYLVRRKPELSRRDTLNALRYLLMAIEKDDDLNPGPAIVAIFAFVYDMAAMDDQWDVATRMHSLVDRIVGKLTVRERRSIAPLYAELLLHMHIVNANEKRFDDALGMTDAAVSMLEEGNDAEEQRDDVRRRFLLAKALYQRGSYHYILQHDLEKTLSDFDRVDALFTETDLLSENESLPMIKDFYIEFLWRYSSVLWIRNDIQRSRVAITTAFRFFMAEIESGSWAVLHSLNKLVYVTLRCAEREDQPVLFFRLARFWTKYIQILRRKFLESGWGVDDSESEIRRNAFILNELDVSLLNISMNRVRFVETHPWNSEYERFIPRESVDGGHDKLVGVGPELVAIHAQGDATTPESFTLEEFYEARATFVKEKLSTTPNRLLQWFDLQKCVRSVERQIESGNFSRMKLLVVALNMLNRLYWKHGEPRLAVAELSVAARVIEKNAARKDKDFHFLFNGADEKTSVAADVDTPSYDWEYQDEFDAFDSFVENVDDENPDDLFWNGAFFIEQLLLIALERLFFGKDTELHIAVNPYLALKDENEAAIWLRRSGVRSEDGSKESYSDAAGEAFDDDADFVPDDESAHSDDRESDNIAGRDDFGQLARERAALLEQTFEAALFCDRKGVRDELWRYFQRFILIKHYYDWLTARGRNDEAKTIVSEQLTTMEIAAKDSSFTANVLMLFCSIIADSVMEPPQDIRYARELLSRITELYEKSAMELLPDSFMGKTYMRLAFIASEEGNKQEESEFLREAADAFGLGIRKDFFNAECAEETAKLLELFFASNDMKDVRCARRLLRQYEESFEANLETFQNEDLDMDESVIQSLTSAWIVFMRAATYYDSERKCFFMAKRFYEKAEKTLDYLSNSGKDALPFELYHAQMAVIAFYGRYSLIKDMVRATRSLSSTCKRLLEREGEDALDENAREGLRRVSLMLDILQAHCFIFDDEPASDPEAIRNVPTRIKTLHEFIGFSLEKRPKTSFFSKKRKTTEDESTIISQNFQKWGEEYFISLIFSEFMNFQTTGLSRLKRRVERIVKDIRRSFAPRSYCEFMALYYWADFLLRHKAWTSTIKVASNLNRKSFAGDDEVDRNRVLMRLDSLKIEAMARFERGRPYDLRRAEKLMNVAFRICREGFANHDFQFRTIYAELLILLAKIEARHNRYEQALEVARRALRLIEKCEGRGMTNWQPELRKGIGPLTEELQTKVDELRLNAARADS